MPLVYKRRGSRGLSSPSWPVDDGARSPETSTNRLFEACLTAACFFLFSQYPLSIFALSTSARDERFMTALRSLRTG